VGCLTSRCSHARRARAGTCVSMGVRRSRLSGKSLAGFVRGRTHTLRLRRSDGGPASL
jgi:hypothetical protein